MNAAPIIKGFLTVAALAVGAFEVNAQTSDFEQQVEAYIQKFPYQETHNYAMNYTKGDPAKFNTWVLGSESALVQAGDDKVVRMNNDTFYKIAFVVPENGPVVLGSSAPATDRFNSCVQIVLTTYSLY